MEKNKSGGKTSRLDIGLNYATIKLKILLNKIRISQNPHKNRVNDGGRKDKQNE